MSTFGQRLGFAAKVNLRQMQLEQAGHDIYQIENVVNDLWLDYANPVGLECLVDNRENIQRAADKLTELLAKIGTQRMEAAE